jgi:adenosylmethionine-8-amino-7-oxononanoate aminotransferase
MNFAPCLTINKGQVDAIVAAVATAIEKTFQ